MKGVIDNSKENLEIKILLDCFQSTSANLKVMNGRTKLKIMECINTSPGEDYEASLEGNLSRVTCRFEENDSGVIGIPAEEAEGKAVEAREYE